MPADQPENPRIRTKLLRIDEKIDDDFFQLLEQLRCKKIRVEEFQAKTLAFVEGLRLSETFAEDIEFAKTAPDQRWLVRRHTNSCRYTILLFRVDEGTAQPPHQHHNLICTQVVVSGRIHFREYQRVGREPPGQLKLRLVRDTVLGPGDVFQASEWQNNVHWFSAEGGPAIIFNINARGYEDTTFNDTDHGPYGRRYLDPVHFDTDGLITAETLNEEEAWRLFHNRHLSDFPVPFTSAGNGGHPTIAI